MSEQNDNPHDELISRLYRLGSSGEPPAHLDQTILDEAQRAAGRWKRVRSWPALATAAVLVLSFSLILRVIEQQPIDRAMVPSESTFDAVIAPVSEGAGDDADAVTDEIKMAAPPLPMSPQSAAPDSRAEATQSMDKSSMEVLQKRKKVVAKERMATAAAPPDLYSAPAAVVNGMVGAMHADEATAVLPAKPEQEMEKDIAQSENCGVALPAAGLPTTAWQQLYRELLEQEKIGQAECLREVFEQRFGHQLELSQKPQSSEE